MPNRFATAAAGQSQNIPYLLSVVADSSLNVQKRNFNFRRRNNAEKTQTEIAFK
jgi:hypothetical protein